MIHCSNVSFAYRLKPVLRDLNLGFLPGRTYGLLGNNGEGKTTLLRLLQGFLFPSSGRIELDGRGEPRNRRRDYLADVLYFPELCRVPSSSLQSFAKRYGCFYPNFNMEQLEYLCSKFAVSMRESIQRMSFGQEKKALLSFAIACGTKVLLLDEPSNGLDIPSKRVFRKVMGEILRSGNRLIVISSHQVRDLEGLMSDILILKGGRALLNARLEDLERKLFSRVEGSPAPEAVYSLEVLGGYANLYRTPSEKMVEPPKLDIELLFQFMLARTEESLAFLESAAAAVGTREE